jgi:hypothetical protein
VSIFTPNAFSMRSAISPERSALPFSRLDRAGRETFRAAAAAVTDKPAGWIISVRMKSPGWGGFFMGIVFAPSVLVVVFQIIASGQTASQDGILVDRTTVMSTAKQDVELLLNRLPDNVSVEDIQYHLYVLDKVRRGLEDARVNGTLSQEEVESRFSKWLTE